MAMVNDLTQAIEAVHTKNVSFRQSDLHYGIPHKTLDRRLKTQKFLKARYLFLD